MISKDFFENIEFESSEEQMLEIENVFQDVHHAVSKDNANILERLKKEKHEVEKMLKNNK
ncbi:hypothetical protein EHP00_900 [Ecytonucleospora hepatopenaei]|uniref:Uncharacterized protein n=1 Tax=Ecytonucleospora hepatopenaei TaxID=646526 RepID=A0A1W0E4S4_9MICR|nr:hypothetical protein EHP00_900 [Ecytonucleospora hepatopenaei]